LGLLPLLPLYTWELVQGLRFEVNRVTGAALAYVALFPSVLAYVFWNRAVHEVGAARSGQFIHLMPVFGTLLSILLLGERLYGFHLLGISLVAIGIALATGHRPG
jgi:drug/metabolite transporter (DMT)-like permease